MVAGVTLAAAILTFTFPPDFMPGRIVTLPLVLVWPGYSLTSALFPNRSLGVPERALFSLALSIILVIVGGLVLNWTPFGLRASSWVVLLGSITLGASAVGLARRGGQHVAPVAWWRGGHIGLTVRQGVLLGLALALLCGAVAISIMGAIRQPSPGYTQLWMLPKGAGYLAYTVQLGISDRESKVMHYRLIITVDGTVVKVWDPIDLQPNQKWERTLVLPQTSHAGAIPVEASLYRVDFPLTAYRHVLLWLGT